MTADAPAGMLRRTPIQARSVERVRRMLDTFESLVAELGYDGVSTTLVAERAEVSVGSLYQFFPDKRALAQALALRYLDVFLQQVQEVVSVSAFGHWWEAVDPIVDIYVEMHRSIPAFRSVRFGDPVDLQLLDGASDNNAVVVSRLDAVIGGLFDIDDDREWPGRVEPRLALAVALEAGDAVLKLAFRLEPLGDPRVIAVAKDVVRVALSDVPHSQR